MDDRDKALNCSVLGGLRFKPNAGVETRSTALFYRVPFLVFTTIDSGSFQEFASAFEAEFKALELPRVFVLGADTGIVHSLVALVERVESKEWVVMHEGLWVHKEPITDFKVAVYKLMCLIAACSVSVPEGG